MEKKQTAVEWFYQRILAKDIKEVFEQAKEMEKEQIVKAHGNQLKKSRGVSNYEYWMSGEEYYNDTYKSE